MTAQPANEYVDWYNRLRKAQESPNSRYWKHSLSVVCQALVRAMPFAELIKWQDTQLPIGATYKDMTYMYREQLRYVTMPIQDYPIYPQCLMTEDDCVTPISLDELNKESRE
jgi:hypothetical protein